MRDKVSYDDLKKKYVKQIKLAPADQEAVEDNSVRLSEGANAAIAKDALLNKQYLRGQEGYDDSKFEAFKLVTKSEREDPVSKTYEYNNLKISDLTNKETRGIFVNSSVDEYNIAKNIFAKSYNLKAAVIDQVIIYVKSADFSGAKIAAAELQKN